MIKTHYHKAVVNNKPQQGCGEIETLIHCWSECKMVQMLKEINWQFLKPLNTELAYNSVIPLLHLFQKELKTK